MKFFKQFSMSFLAVAATAASAATSQPFVATTANVTLDTSYLTANGYTVSAVGSSTYTAATGVLTDPVQAVNLAVSPGPVTIDFSDTSGMAIKKGLTTVKLTNFTYDVATNSLFGDISAGLLLNLSNQSLLTANTVFGNFGGIIGGQELTSVTSSSTSRVLGLAASDFVLSDAFNTFLTDNGVDPAAMAFVATMVKSVNIGAVPEPSTYVLMGLGLVGIAATARRKMAA
ncbi:PEP-CTERM sorting domain-containing protein [Aquabacterium sp.]|uniref:PEP-CTERM sorting domain-containing protein n=1 Tax=Aquabacterium sp. TaxID=1872578 RepID=UPI0040383F0A